MKIPFSLHSATIALALLLSGVASAQTVVLTPLISKGASEKDLQNVGSLISSELDFRPEFEGARELTERPPSLNISCLSSSSCLRKIAQDAGADSLVAGTLATSPTTFTLDLVLYDANAGRTVRRQQWTLPSSPEAVADGMGGVVLELVTGTTREEALAAEDEVLVTEVDIDDDFEFDDPESLENWDPEEEARAQEEARRRAEEEARQRAEEEARQRAEEEARRRAEEERRRAEEERRRQEEEARRRAEEERRRQEEARRRAEAERRRQEEEARRRAEEERRRQEEEARRRSEEEEEFDPSMISFGSVSPDQIEIDSAEDIQFGSPSSITIESAGSSSSASSSADRTYYEDDLLDEEEEDDDAIVDLDTEDEDVGRPREPRVREPKPPKEPRVREPKPPKEPRVRQPRPPKEPRVQRDPDRDAVAPALRGGYSNFQAFNFITAGGELSFPLGSGVYGMAGLESYSVERQIPPVHQEGNQTTEWNTIFPINLGVAYKLTDGKIDPYFGGDLIMAQYYFDESGKASWSVGGRARAGVDIMLTDQLGLNANAAVGYWSGKNWAIIQRDLEEGGLLPQISVGAVVQF